MKLFAKYFFTGCLLSFLILQSSCTNSPDLDYKKTVVNVVLSYPDNQTLSEMTNLHLDFKNVTNNRSYSFSDISSVLLIPGIYNVSFTADIILPDETNAQLKANLSSVIIGKSDTTVTLNLFINPVSDDFVIGEIFFAGTLQSSGNQYYGDNYITIFNNTDHILYADGLAIFESKFTTTEKYNYFPDIMDEAMTVQALYTIPGTGMEHPVRPGEFILVADAGIDHRIINPNSFDLSGADWEWYDVSSVPTQQDIDSPSVPNLEKLYSYTKSVWLLHNRGFRAYGLARIPVDYPDYLADYRYSFDYEIVVEAGTFPMSSTACKLPNSWIVDVVNCSVESEYAWNVCHPSLDSGWTFCGTIDNDKTRYFHSVRRKLAGFNSDGKPILQDTNNSSIDFNPFVTPSIIEEQGTAVNLEGSQCTSYTWDGVIPRSRK